MGWAVTGTDSAGNVYGDCGVAAWGADYGVNAKGGTLGVWGSSDSGVGVKGQCDDSNGQAVLGDSEYGIAIRGYSAYGTAGKFEGNVSISGNLSLWGNTVMVGSLDVQGGTLRADVVDSSIKQFKIDHPLDPANKYLVHASVESSELINIYNGNATLDDSGQAAIELPAWCGALNQDFRYQLTAIGAPGPNLYIAQEIHGNRFRIAGGSPGMKVSWQVTGVRHDPYAEAHRVQVEEDKPAAERGCYLHPELYGQPAERSIEWARHEGPRLIRAERDQRQLGVAW